MDLLERVERRRCRRGTEPREQSAGVPQEARRLARCVLHDGATGGTGRIARDPRGPRAPPCSARRHTRSRRRRDDRGRRASSSWRVGNRCSRSRVGYVRGVQIQVPRGRRAASARSQSCSSRSIEGSRTAARPPPAATSSACTCVSMKPGTTVRPRPSITRVAGPMCRASRRSTRRRRTGRRARPAPSRCGTLVDGQDPGVEQHQIGRRRVPGEAASGQGCAVQSRQRAPTTGTSRRRRASGQPSVQVLLHELVVCQVRIAGEDAVDVVHLTRAQSPRADSRHQRPASRPCRRRTS